MAGKSAQLRNSISGRAASGEFFSDDYDMRDEQEESVDFREDY
jgi:hypothetical protein